ncbi:NifB/NifX family molybdenum-iron cluster-binding protein [Candidatus Magnetaquicoccus inordinatus]|uniref:NifB/NifX family molybdenum-iron cluster-binding protein n=1 Tax=Candidatus Magnetaquicoccus inordinatus TaxID=2496818 RepID=UPI00187D20E9|nr:NifB/NifX family molybdenum-iron cluster-binding protein [Candidatus Magnetaquicoccus inordinatus]
MPNKLPPTPVPGTIRVVCASDSGVAIDGHFATCRHYFLYDVGVHELHYAATLTFEGKGELEKRLALLQGSSLACMAQIGGPAAARVSRAGILPLKMPAGTQLDGLLQSLQKRLATAPPRWLALKLGEQCQQTLSLQLQQSQGEQCQQNREEQQQPTMGRECQQGRGEHQHILGRGCQQPSRGGACQKRMSAPAQ